VFVLQDIKDLQLTPNPTFKPSAEKGDAYIDRQSAPYICPVIGLEMNGKFRFVFLWGCGCVRSERALKEVKTKLCHKVRGYPKLEEDRNNKMLRKNVCYFIHFLGMRQCVKCEKVF
jgi:hypothetical protein